MSPFANASGRRTLQPLARPTRASEETARGLNWRSPQGDRADESSSAQHVGEGSPIFALALVSESNAFTTAKTEGPFRARFVNTFRGGSQGL